MKNNCFEENIDPKSFSENLREDQSTILDNMGIPSWTRDLKCPYCKKILTDISIRSISLKLNARNIGDIAVEFLCEHCMVGNTLYFTKEVIDMRDFIEILDDTHPPKSNPITEEEMYQKKYHNTIEYNKEK